MPRGWRTGAWVRLTAAMSVSISMSVTAVDEQPAFYLASSDSYDQEAPRRCYPIKRVLIAARDGLVIAIDPPLIGQQFGLGDPDVDRLVVATRHVGASLFPVDSWPVHVHVARALVNSPEDRDDLAPGEYEVIAWAALYRTEVAAWQKALEE